MDARRADHDGSGEPAPSRRLRATSPADDVVADRPVFRRCGAWPILTLVTPRNRSELATVLFTDIVESTEPIAEIGSHACFTFVDPEGDLWLLRSPT